MTNKYDDTFGSRRGPARVKISLAAAIASLAAVLGALLLGPAPTASALWTEAWGSGVASFGGQSALTVGTYEYAAGHAVNTFSTGNLVVKPVENGSTAAQQVKVRLTLMRSETLSPLSWQPVSEDVIEFTVDLRNAQGGNTVKTVAGKTFFHFHTPGSAAAYKVVANFRWLAGSRQISERNVAASQISELSCGALAFTTCLKSVETANGQAYLVVA